MNPPSRPEHRSEGGPAAEPWSAREGIAAVLIAQIVLIFAGSTVIALGGWSSGDVPIVATLGATVPFWVAIAVAASTLGRRDGGETLRGATPRPVDVAAATAAGVAVQLVVVPAFYWVVFRFTSFDTDDLEEPARRLGESATGAGGALLLVVMAVRGAPFFEEVLYRGILLPPLRRRVGPGLAIAVAAVVFALFHFQPLQFPGLVLLGLAAGWFREYRGGLVAAIVVHASFNLVTVVELLA